MLNMPTTYNRSNLKDRIHKNLFIGKTEIS